MRIDCMLSAGITQACRLLRAKTRASSDLNPNRRASAVAKKFRKPLIATSDAHRLHAFGRHYTSMPAPAREDARLFRSESEPPRVGGREEISQTVDRNIGCASIACFRPALHKHAGSCARRRAPLQRVDARKCFCWFASRPAPVGESVMFAL